MTPEDFKQIPGASHWSELKDNELSQEDLDRALDLASRLARSLCRVKAPWVDEFEVESFAGLGAWYAWCRYPRNHDVEFMACANRTIRQFMSKSISLQRGKGAAQFLRTETASLDDYVSSTTQSDRLGDAIPDPRSESRFDQFYLQEIVSALPPAQRVIVEAQFFGGEPPALPSATMSHRKKQALANLRRALLDQPMEPDWAAGVELLCEICEKPFIAKKKNARICGSVPCQYQQRVNRLEARACCE